MSKKQDAFYFDNFAACAEDACKAAHMLKDVLSDFHQENISECLKRSTPLNMRRMIRSIS